MKLVDAELRRASERRKSTGDRAGATARLRACSAARELSGALLTLLVEAKMASRFGPRLRPRVDAGSLRASELVSRPTHERVEQLAASLTSYQTRV